MINVNELKEFLGSDDEFINQLMLKFIEETKDGVERLKSASDEKSWQNVKLMAHKMLSSTRIFNLEEMSSQLEKIEAMAENNVNTDKIPDLITDFEKNWKSAIDEMKSMIQGTSS